MIRFLLCLLLVALVLNALGCCGDSCTKQRVHDDSIEECERWILVEQPDKTKHAYVAKISHEFSEDDEFFQIWVWVDTGKLSRHTDACEDGTMELCPDHVQLEESELLIEELLPNPPYDNITYSSSLDENDAGEDFRTNHETDKKRFAILREALLRGELRVRIHPSANDEYDFYRVRLRVKYRPIGASFCEDK